eukprot:COSAG01_NODE_1619_length_9715_cov_29.912958_10_plen_53_part_00
MSPPALVERIESQLPGPQTLVIGSNTKDGTSQFYSNAQNASLGEPPTVTPLN